MSNDIEAQLKQWLIISHGLYFRPNARGYTGIRDEAGLYTKEEADVYRSAKVVHISEAPEFLPDAYTDLVINHLKKQRDDALQLLSAAQGRILPEGWVAVPVEPTTDRLLRGHQQRVQVLKGVDTHLGEDALRKIYKAMIAPAPKIGGE